MWDNVTGEAAGPREVVTKFGVFPEQIADLLAIAGDAGDAVPGVPGIGIGSAASILRAHSSLEQALAATVDDAAELDVQIKAAGKAIKSGPAAERDTVTAIREELKARKTLARYHAKLVEHQELARFSRALTSLDCDAPIRIPWEDLATGGYNVTELRRRYTSLGFVRKAEQVSFFPKRPPWAIGHEEA